MKRVLIAHNIRSLQNIGAFFRTADGAGFDKVILTGYTCTPPRKEISKTALWAEESMDWDYYEHIEEVLQVLKEDGYTVIALEEWEKSVDYRNMSTNIEKIAIILGNEVEWVERELLDQVDQIVSLPMRGIKKSLNVSVAAGIIMYHFTQNK